MAGGPGFLAVIALHNLFDGVDPSRFTPVAWMWNLLHQPEVIPFDGRQALTTYTLLPWIGVMVAGFCFGSLYTLEPVARRRIMVSDWYWRYGRIRRASHSQSLW